ncbi:MAG: S41 family peptidase [Culturomica sp.]|jgi:carboxyl-terminal processing protease|nr:S41 family peptidase [Culturomica sp.]
MKTKKIIIYSILLIVLIIGGFSFSTDDKNFEISKQLSIFSAIFREVNMFYVDETDPGNLVNTGTKAMLKSLDPYTIYYPESEMEDVKLMTTGEYAGIGAVIGKKGDNIIIREPYKNSPATKAGLLPGDIIIEADGNSIKGKKVEDVSEILKGQPGKSMKIKIIREGSTMEFTLVREQIQIPSVPYYGMINDNVGYISFSSFIQNSSNDVRKAIIDLKNKGAKSLIFDLRGNGGGLLDQAVEIANFFLPQYSKIVYTKGRISQLYKEYYATKHPIVPDMPLAVLIDRNSASASEIVSGALQDYDRAVLIGERSLGKGLVQTVKDLPYNTKIKITTAKYYIPSGRSIQAIDYSHRTESGVAQRIADSLKREFLTADGRKVYDGGGISPDIEVKSKDLSNIITELIVKDLYFDFVNSYALKHSNIATPSEFKVTDEIYDTFIEFLKKHDFTYESESQKILEQLLKSAKEEKYYESNKAELNILKTNLTHSIERDATIFKEDISKFLAEFLIQRYYFSEGLIEYNSLHDEEIGKALSILGNQTEYKRILGK